MSDTNLTKLIVNHLTRDELHNADFTDHGNELFVQKNHAGVSVGGVGVDALDTTNITNCITEIPQDIKLELSSDGVLTLKGGSKVYKPNGVGVFDEFIINADKSFSDTDSSTYKALVFYDGSTAITICSLSECASGTSLPSSFSGVFYNTTTNKINFYASGIKIGPDYYLPVGIVTMSGASGITSIDQVFNGFGYIGSTVFALPGVKGLIPNGRNADGSLKNTEFTITQVSTLTIGGNKPIHIAIRNNGKLAWWNVSATRYDANQNLNYYNNNIQYYSVVGKFDVSNGQIKNFTPYNTFHAVDYNDTEYIGHQAMPSDRYIDLTLGASGVSYTMPADGYVFIKANSNNAQGNVSVVDNTTSIATSTTASYSGFSMYVYLPVCKGDIVKVYFNDATLVQVRFIYAQGAQ